MLEIAFTTLILNKIFHGPDQVAKRLGFVVMDSMQILAHYFFLNFH